MAADRAAYEILIDFVEKLITGEKVKIGDRLPPERELSEILGISRSAVRTGLTVLEAIGVIANRQGSGNYIANDFDQNMVHIMTMMYTLDSMSYKEISGFRYAAALQAAMLAPQNITEAQKRLLNNYSDIMMTSNDENERIHCDKMIHRTIVEASGNRLVIANYLALNKLLDKMIKDVQHEVFLKSHEEYTNFMKTHQMLVDGICNNDFDLTRQALSQHFVYLQKDILT